MGDNKNKDIEAKNSSEKKDEIEKLKSLFLTFDFDINVILKLDQKIVYKIFF